MDCRNHRTRRAQPSDGKNAGHDGEHWARPVRSTSPSSPLTVPLLIPKTYMTSSWVPRLHDTFSEQDLIDVRKDFYPIAPHSRLYWSQLQFNSNEEYSYLGMDNSTPDAVGPQYRNLISQAGEEGRNGAAFNFTLEVTIGRKAA